MGDEGIEPNPAATSQLLTQKGFTVPREDHLLIIRAPDGIRTRTVSLEGCHANPLNTTGALI